MKAPEFRRACFLTVVALAASLPNAVAADTNSVLSQYHVYRGNTHAHTLDTWSHGEQWARAVAGDDKESKLTVTREGIQFPPKASVLKANWQKVQGPPSVHFALAKSNGYDFYITTDHSQEATLSPPSATNTNWVAAGRAADEATDADFVAIRGYEHSENNGPGGKGHLNVINTAEYLNALAPGIDLPYLYKWLKTAAPNGDGPVVVSFNHPGPKQYDDWANCDPEIADIITMLEVINSNTKIHYEAFVNALDKGWKVSPVCGNDNHGLTGIKRHTSRTCVLATAKTKTAILEAMKHRRTYASLDGNIDCRYSVNGMIMGSSLQKPDVFKFDILVSDSDTDKPGDKITKIDIVKDGGAVVQTYSPAPAYSVEWTPTINDSTNKYFFVRVWNGCGGDAANADPAKPIAWLAPVWTGR